MVHLDGGLRLQRRRLRHLRGGAGHRPLSAGGRVRSGLSPRPEQLLQSVIDLQDKITRTGTLRGKEFDRNSYEGPRPLALELPLAEQTVAPANFASATPLRN